MAIKRVLKLYLPSIEPIRTENMSLVQKDQRVIDTISGKRFFNKQIDEKRAQECFPRFGPLVNVRARYLVFYSACEHSRGASLHDQQVDIINLVTGASRTIHGDFCEQVIYQSPDSNPQLESLHFLHYINGKYSYNTRVNAGKPCLEMVSVSLPGCGITNRWVIEIPEALRQYYNHENVSFVSAKLLEKNGAIMARCAPMLTAKAQASTLAFEVSVPLT
jgi:hypothetical protein